MLDGISQSVIESMYELKDHFADAGKVIGRHLNSSHLKSSHLNTSQYISNHLNSIQLNLKISDYPKASFAASC